MASHILWKMKNDGVGGRVYPPTDVTSYEREVCTRYMSALCSPSRISLRTALVCRGFIIKDTSVCGLIWAAIGAPTRLRIKEKSGHYNGPIYL